MASEAIHDDYWIMALNFLSFPVVLKIPSFSNLTESELDGNSAFTGSCRSCSELGQMHAGLFICVWNITAVKKKKIRK